MNELKNDSTQKKTKELLLSITNNCENFIEQTHRKPQETLEYKLNKSRQTFHFKPSISLDESWMICSPGLKVYNSIFNITEENTKFEIYFFLESKLGGIAYEKVGEKIGKDLEISDITATDLKMKY